MDVTAIMEMSEDIWKNSFKYTVKSSPAPVEIDRISDGIKKGISISNDEVKELKLALEQACNDLNSAHDEICKLQKIDPKKFDWPEWTPQANTIRWAEKLLGKKLSKT
jgi:hypothetical protein